MATATPKGPRPQGAPLWGRGDTAIITAPTAAATTQKMEKQEAQRKQIEEDENQNAIPLRP